MYAPEHARYLRPVLAGCRSAVAKGDDGTRVALKAHPVPTHERRAAYTFSNFEAGIEACRLILRRGATGTASC